MVKLFFLSDLPRTVVHCAEINDVCARVHLRLHAYLLHGPESFLRS